MPTTTTYDFGDIVLVPFPFTDQTIAKKRPAVVVSSASYNDRRPDLVLMAVTSQARPTSAGPEVAVTRWKEAGLLKPSVVKPVITTAHKRLVVRKLGRLREQDRRAVRACLDQILGS
jgi:mRNA interferase MazF